MPNLYDGIQAIIDKNAPEETASATIMGIGDTFVMVKMDNAKSSIQCEKPSGFNGARGDSCSLYRNTRTRKWQISEVRSAVSAAASAAATQTARVLIASGKLASAAASISVAGIPDTYQNLELVLSLRGDQTGVATEAVRIVFNSDTSANYDRTVSIFTTTTQYVNSFGETAAVLNNMVTNIGANLTTTMGKFWGVIAGYSQTGFRRHFRYNNAFQTTNAVQGISEGVASWRNTADAIHSITISPNVSSNFMAGSCYEIYGVGAKL